MAPRSLPPVLVIDDNEDDLHLLKRLLGKAGLKNPVVTFPDALAAISFLKAATSTADSGLVPCLIFTDLKMPDIDGLAFTKWIRTQKTLTNVTVIVISNSGVERDAKQAKAAGADKFFPKFPTADEIAKLVKQAC